MPFAQADDMAGELVAGAGFHRHALEQLAELLEIAGLAIVHAGAQAVERGLVFGLQRPVERDGLAAVVGEQRAAAVLAAGRAEHQRLVGQVVHGIDRIPGGLVGNRHGFCGLGNRAVQVNRLEQADAGVAEKAAELGIDFKFAAQAVQSRGHYFVMS
jgi:hypothetical protein